MNAMMPTVSASVDVSSITKAIALATRSTSQKMEKLLINTAFYTAVKARNYTPFVSISTIDQEMEVTVTPVISAGAKKGEKNITSNKKAPFTLTIAQKIVLARMNPGSAFNIATSGRWQILYQNLRGIGGFRILEEIAERMIRARHSSTHFLQSGWKSVIQQIKTDCARLQEGNQEQINENTLNSLEVSELGNMRRGGMGTPTQFVTITNMVGMTSGHPNLDQEHNNALIAHGTPALQRACDEQAQDMRDHYLPKVNEELAAEWNAVPDAAPFQKGVHFSSVRAAEAQSVFDVEIGQDLSTFSGL